MQQHLFVAGEGLLITGQVQAVIEMQAFFIVAHELGADLNLGAELHFVQVVHVQLQGEQRMTAGLAALAVQSQAVHQGIGGIAENQQVKRIP